MLKIADIKSALFCTGFIEFNQIRLGFSDSNKEINCRPFVLVVLHSEPTASQRLVIVSIGILEMRKPIPLVPPLVKLVVVLTHWGRDKMDTISQTTLSNAFS